MSLSLIWYENDDYLRVVDSSGDEVEAYWGNDAEILRHHSAFGESFPVDCQMVKDFEHEKRAFVSFYYEHHQCELWEVLDMLILRRHVLATISGKLEERLDAAIRGILQPTRLSPWSADIVRDVLRSNAWDLFEPIMIHYLAYILPRFNFQERIWPEFYREGLQGFEAYSLTSDLTLPYAATPPA